MPIERICDSKVIETGKLDAGTKFGMLGRHHDTELRYLLATQLTGTRKSVSRCSLVCVAHRKKSRLGQNDTFGQCTFIG